MGQSEFAAADLVDMFCLLVPPAAGDEIQALKRGIVELADLVLVNKADGDLQVPARKAAVAYSTALSVLRTRSDVWKPKVLKVSAMRAEGLDKVYEELERLTLLHFCTFAR